MISLYECRVKVLHYQLINHQRNKLSCHPFLIAPLLFQFVDLVPHCWLSPHYRRTIYYHCLIDVSTKNYYWSPLLRDTTLRLLFISSLFLVNCCTMLRTCPRFVGKIAPKCQQRIRSIGYSHRLSNCLWIPTLTSDKLMTQISKPSLPP